MKKCKIDISKQNITVVCDYTNTMKTTLDINFYLYQAIKQIYTQKHRSKKKLSIKKP